MDELNDINQELIRHYNCVGQKHLNAAYSSVAYASQVIYQERVRRFFDAANSSSNNDIIGE
jgi:hypothetical protein